MTKQEQINYCLQQIKIRKIIAIQYQLEGASLSLIQLNEERIKRLEASFLVLTTENEEA